jgi:hypothetical protein
MVYNSDTDAAMNDLKKGMLLLRENPDPDSILFWEALLEVNKALAIVDTERALSYLRELLKVPVPSQFEFRDVYAYIRDAHERLEHPGINLEYLQSIVKEKERKYGIKLNS